MNSDCDLLGGTDLVKNNIQDRAEHLDYRNAQTIYA